MDDVENDPCPFNFSWQYIRDVLQDLDNWQSEDFDVEYQINSFSPMSGIPEYQTTNAQTSSSAVPFYEVLSYDTLTSLAVEVGLIDPPSWTPAVQAELTNPEPVDPPTRRHVYTCVVEYKKSIMN